MRDCLVILVAGKKRVGKTWTTIEMLDDALRGNPEKGIAPRRSLIFDVNNEFSDFKYGGFNRRIKAISIKDVARFSSSSFIEIRRISPFFDDGRKMSISDMQEVLGEILASYRNGILLVEDLNKYVGDNINTDLIGNLATARHIGLDIICHYQQISRVGNPKLLGNANLIRFHKTNDTVLRHANKFEEKTELLQLAENIVNYYYNVRGYEDEKYKRFYVWVDVDESKIKPGNYAFTDEDIYRSIQEYLSDNKNRNALIRPLINSIDMETGKKTHTPVTAIKLVAEQLKKTYFD